MQQPKLSIIITCYNLGEYLKDAIGSIKEYGNSDDYEIILVNDGSTDLLTIATINEILKKDATIHYINQSNLGLAKARNNGIKLAKGNYIIPLDADNKVRQEFIAQTISILDDNPNTAVVHGDAQNFGNKTNIWKSKPFYFPEMLLNNYIDACAGFRKSAWEKLGGYDVNMPVMGFEDWDLWLRMAVKGYQFHYVETVLFDYRVRENSLLSKAWKERSLLIDYIFEKKELKHLLPFRNCLIENQKLKEEPSVKMMIQVILKKIKRKFSF
ncbi:glycosyltransferase family 2 protein [Flavobacterium sp.]|uniref:glycosyltransferase family 2 protein n=1 Tax=Flavobacterium sp. TaxID=239 RepID=UPI00374FE2D8